MKKKNENADKSKFDYRTIKTVADAYEKTGLVMPSLPELPSSIAEEFREALLAVYNLFVVFKAINDGWVADYTDWNQTKYYPWQRVNSAGSGFDFSRSTYYYDYTCTAVGSRLCTDTSEKALYIGKQFSPEYKKFMLYNK
jgi:hypothetical protein